MVDLRVEGLYLNSGDGALERGVVIDLPLNEQAAIRILPAAATLRPEFNMSRRPRRGTNFKISAITASYC
ncbi:hypothetical protein [Acidocella sp.]|uniref:hypothetical protein n=1 Tax=Acidocella sp. TaxID=50710 RepID=UPI002F3EAE2C